MKTHNMLKKIPLAICAAVFATTCAISAETLDAMTPKAVDEGPDKAYFKVSAGATAKSGNTESDLYTARVETGSTMGKTILDMTVDGAYAEAEVEDSDGTRQKRRTEGKVKGIANAKQRMNGYYFSGTGSALHDSIADVNFRGIIGGGVGTFLADSDKFKFSVEGGVSYVYELSQEDDDYFALRFAERIDYKISDTTKFWERVEVLPEIADFGNCLISAEAGIETAINSKISCGVIYQLEYNSEPNSDLEKTDTTLSVHVTYSI